MTRKQRKKKWIGAAVLLLMAELIPVQASSLNPFPIRKAEWGTCDGGDDCCGGTPEAVCERHGTCGGFKYRPG